MGKFCIFCGNEPASRTLEHVIPRWLVELTGDPNRPARFGPVWDDSTKRFETRTYAFDQFIFPACGRCNRAYSELEARTQSAVSRMLRHDTLSAQDLETLLTWLDKVRIGLWLGMYYLRRQVSDIEPHTFISSRLSTSDRCVLIYRATTSPSGVFLLGLETLAFQYLPCCFGLIINHIGLFNISADFLLARRLGLPYPTRVSWRQWPEVAYEIHQGRMRSSLPLITKRFDSRCSQVYQPIFTRALNSAANFYDNHHARALADPNRPGFGRVFHVQDGPLRQYPIQPAADWLPARLWGFHPMYLVLARQVLQFQTYLFDIGPKARDLDPDRAEILKLQHKLARELNRMRLEQIEELT